MLESQFVTIYIAALVSFVIYLLLFVGLACLVRSRDVIQNDNEAQDCSLDAAAEIYEMARVADNGAEPLNNNRQVDDSLGRLSPRNIGAETEIAGNSQSAIGMIHGMNSEMSPFKAGGMISAHELHNNMSADGRTMEIEESN